MKTYLAQRIDTTKTTQKTSDDGTVKITYHHDDMGMKYRVQVNTGTRSRPRWHVVGYANDYLPVLNTFNRIVSDRAKASRAWN